MADYVIDIREIAKEGQDFRVADPAVWTEPIREFGLDVTVSRPVEAEVFVLPQEDGVLIRGTMRGQVSMPCSRCSEMSVFEIDTEFDEFEDMPQPDAGEEEYLISGHSLRWEGGSLKLDLAEFLWEEFSLALPVKPLCREDCKGVCPVCGTDLNKGTCSCAGTSEDPRLAVLRGFKVQ